ncbi:hypothetical protein ACS0TY_028207 [Phlomoides rotata]
MTYGVVKLGTKLGLSFLDNKNGSRVMITTRLSNLAFDLSGSRDFQMNFLDENTSWALLCKTVFGEEASFINLENDEYCLQLLRTSYKELPVHLKSCFLYMEIFPEDYEIRISKLIKLLVAEGILRRS